MVRGEEKMRNPLIRRIPKELKNEWHKYLVIIVFMVIMIGVISGMYVGHDSMLYSVEAGKKELVLEDGSFELEKKASKKVLDAIEKGDMADVRQYYIDKGMNEADEEVSKFIEEELDKKVTAAIKEQVRKQCLAYGITDEKIIEKKIDEAIESSFDKSKKEIKESKDYKKSVKEAYDKAHEKVIEKVNEKWDEIADRYNLNDKDFEAVPVTIYENFYKEATEDKDCNGKVDANVRIFKSDSEIDKASFNEGRAPETDDEIAIDRMHASNVGISIGNKIEVSGKKFTVVGLLSYVDYLTLHESNTDLMFDAFGFDVAMVTPSAFDSFKERVHYNYAYLYKKKPIDKITQSDYADNFLKALITKTVVNDNKIENYLPEYLRQASNFAPSDIEGDSSTTSILCYILIGVIAFIFAITISNTIDKESLVIGTLRASGYSKRELIVHYMSMPLIVTVIGAIIGNVLGYTAFKNIAVNLYYESYSLPTCHLVWSNTAIIKTTVIPLILMFCINLCVIAKKLQLSPLRFLRHDLTNSKRTKARRLPKWSFMKRFRLRILFQNIPNYLVLVFGVIFIELMMCFAFGLPDSLNNYADNATDMMFSDYQYILMDYKDEEGKVIETKEKTAEKFSMASLMYEKEKSSFRTGMGSGGDESVSVYGIADDSMYVTLLKKTTKGQAYISSAFASKFGISTGDTVALHEEYENKTYNFKIVGEIQYDGGIALFMSGDSFNKFIKKKEGEFSGFFSKNKINDIADKDIATVITKDDVLKVVVQLKHSLGGIMGVFKIALIVLAASLIYLLAKIIIERNEGAISMTKILGFSNMEIASLYMAPTAVVVTLCSVVGFAAGYYLMTWVFRIFMLQMDGYFAFYLRPVSMILSVVYLLIGYAFVSVVDYIRIKKIPMDVALKNVE